MAELTVISLAEVTARIIVAIGEHAPREGQTAESFLEEGVAAGAEDVIRMATMAARSVIAYINECVQKGQKLDLGDAKAMN